MAFLETRGMLAKLLATENLIVEHDANARTASFNTADRVLKLPVLNTESEYVYNLFVAHEVGHALQTPVNWKEDIPKDVPFDFVNVIEDVRIERYIQNKFPGLKVDFSKGYDELNNKDFFGLEDVDISKMSFIDRINLFFKLGVRAFVPFSDEEQTYVDAVDNADTWQKVLLVSKMLAEYTNQKGQDSMQDNTSFESGNSQSDDDAPQQQEGSKTDSDDKEEQEEQDDDNGEDTVTKDDDTVGKGNPDMPESVSQTQRNFDDSLENMTDNNMMGKEFVYIQHGDINLADIITSISEIRESMVFSNPEETYTTGYQQHKLNMFLKSIKPEVNHMVQQFEMKKSADAYARQQTNKTGILDTNNLHNYKLTDDLFLRQSITPDGKCHGMVMFLDWSGSMSDIAFDTIKQIITLTQFCRKVQIPFDVYMFTSGDRDDYLHKKNVKKYDLCNTAVSLMHVLTSDAKAKQIDKDIYHLWCSAMMTTHVPFSPHLRMGGTPLDNALLIVPEIIKEFRNRTNAQKVSFVCITDGESAPVYYYAPRRTYDGKEYLGATYAHWNTVMLRHNGKVSKIESRPDSTASIVQWLKSELTDVSITNLFLGKFAKSSSYIKSFGENMDEKVFRKNGCYVTTSKSWPLLGVINPSNFSDTTDEIAVDDGATKTQIKAALNKMLKTKNSSKLILTQLIHQFA